MKIILPVLILYLAFIACTKQNATPANPANEMVDTTSSLVIYKGSFANGPFGVVSGTVNIYESNGNHILALKEFETSNGPDLHVYLSGEEQPIHFIDLGKLKSTSGYQVYNIPANTDFNVYKYALIHCQEYNHLFGSTLLEKE